MPIKIRGVTELARRLKIDLDRALVPAYVAIAEVIRNEIAPYPPAIPAKDKRWYERGYGSKYRRKDGGITGRKTSEMLGRRWDVQAGPVSAVVRNNASYAPFVHDDERQAAVHRRTGWVTDRQAVDRVARSGAWDRILGTAVRKTLGID